MSLQNALIAKPLQLRFTGDLEGIFREDYFHKSLSQLRFGVALGTILYGLFGILDALVYPEVKAQIWFIRYVVVCPFNTLAILFTYSPRFKKYMQLTVSAAVLVSGAGIIAMMMIVRSPINYFHFAGLLLILMYSFTFSKLRFLYTTVVALLLVVLYEVAALTVMHTPLPVLLNDNFFYVSAMLIGMFSCYHRELYMRRDFLQNIMVRNLEEKNHLMEKEKILRDLHDGIGGIATNISMLAELARKAGSLEEARKTLAVISELSREELAEIRNYMRCLDAREMTWNLVVSELGNQGRNVVEPHGIRFSVTASFEEASGRPGSILWLNLFRIYKESLTNVIKHARARTVQAHLYAGHDRLRLTVTDDGAGFGDARGTGRGLHHMQARAEEVGGRVTVSSGTGTTVALEIPLPVQFSEQAP